MSVVRNGEAFPKLNKPIINEKKTIKMLPTLNALFPFASTSKVNVHPYL
jgi:hypothetical protein